VEHGSRLTVRVEADDADDKEVDHLIRQLRREVLDRTDVEAAELVASAHEPTGAKGAGLVELGQLAVQLAPAALPGLIGVLRSWMSRPHDSKTRVILRFEDRSLELEYPVGTMTHQDLKYLIGALSGERSAGDDSASQPGQDTGQD
jgi:hypothetical protein